jgi:hypothetical protein
MLISESLKYATPKDARLTFYTIWKLKFSAFLKKKPFATWSDIRNIWWMANGLHNAVLNITC